MVQRAGRVGLEKQLFIAPRSLMEKIQRVKCSDPGSSKKPGALHLVFPCWSTLAAFAAACNLGRRQGLLACCLSTVFIFSLTLDVLSWRLLSSLLRKQLCSQHNAELAAKAAPAGLLQPASACGEAACLPAFFFFFLCFSINVQGQGKRRRFPEKQSGKASGRELLGKWGEGKIFPLLLRLAGKNP